ncbi:hypothetical protein M427DRAFT_34309 [Gonapodya prolifera JEL478]|uniref:Uncharacterized protein n=1 Tax=Gonapodya prolifera (strain JEL478) TaxID=1344416 RepID=A0A139A9K8_GONPJ|nr:hypothetical protein M427DRAFT_34309 [Gonapodya prolifera JEL478]|eukprot:KXS13083.1 hypothetical protein M427DRAFT_34309 [Gonapodya prolifera JEL478]
MAPVAALARRAWDALRPQLRSPLFWFTVLMLTVVVTAGAILFMVLTNFPFARDFPKSQKDQWIEITSQILNACFTLQALIVVVPRLIMARAAWRLWGIQRRRVDSARSVEEQEKTGSDSGSRDTEFDRRAPELATMLFGDAHVRIVPDDRSAPSPAAIAPVKGDDTDDVALGRATHPPTLIPRKTTMESGASVDTDQTAFASTDASAGAESKRAESPLNHAASASSTTTTTALTSTTTSPTIPATCPLSHAALLILLLNLNHLFQWPMAAVMWGWASDYANRPSWAVYVFLILSFTCGAVGAVGVARVVGRAGKERKGAGEGV